MEIAVVGPEIRWCEEPKSAATIAGTMAEYSPYSGGSPAIIANATPCGSTMIAPVIPASRSARVLRRSARASAGTERWSAARAGAPAHWACRVAGLLRPVRKTSGYTSSGWVRRKGDGQRLQGYRGQRQGNVKDKCRKC